MIISTFAGPVAPVVFAFTMVYAGLTDLTTMKIRNSLVLLFLLAYAVLAPVLGFAVYDIGWSAAVAAGVLVFTFSCFTFGWIGGGDAKLAAVTALWFGVDHTPIYLIYTALLGGVLSFAILQFRTMTLPAFFAGQLMDRAVAFAGVRNSVWSCHGLGCARRISSNTLDDFRFLISQLLKKDIENAPSCSPDRRVERGRRRCLGGARHAKRSSNSNHNSSRARGDARGIGRIFRSRARSSAQQGKYTLAILA